MKIRPSIGFFLLIHILTFTNHASSEALISSDILEKELNQILIAAEKYTRDTGELIPISHDTDLSYGYLEIDVLVKDPGVSGWKGPYLHYHNDNADKSQYLDHSEYKEVYLLNKEDGMWNIGSKPTGCNRSSTSCSIAACAWGVPGEIVRSIDINVDGLIDSKNREVIGKVRYDDGFFSGIICLVGNTYFLNKYGPNN